MRRWLAVGAGAGALALALAGCSGGGSSTTSASGGSGSGSSSSGAGSEGGTLKVLQGTAPDSLDPSYGYTTQAAEADNVVYTPLLAYAAKGGTAGTELVPGLAQALPTVSADGLTYDLTLRPNLKYSDGTAVKASDFTFAVERAIKLSWGGSSFFTGYIAGASDYQSGKATSISGITTDDSTGKIEIKLSQAYGAFENVIAFPASAPLKPDTPMSVQSTTMPIGVGPYAFSAVVPNQSYTLKKNASFSANGISDVPNGHLDEVDVSVQSNTTTEAEQVLSNQADLFDPSDTVPSGLLAQVKSQANGRYEQVSTAFTYYFFLDVTQAPFNNEQARLAVNTALDRTALARLASGSITPACYFLPPTIAGHPDGYSSCPGGNPAVSPSAAQVAKAKQMVADAGLTGAPVTVWSQTRSPRQQYCEYFTNLLNQIGFKATLKVVQDSVYFQTIGNQSTKAQAGFADWSQDFPNPSDFYLLLSKAAIQPVNNENFGNVDDPTIEAALAKLEPLPSGQLSANAAQWQQLDEYVASKGYVAPFGYGTAPKFTSTNVDFADYQLSPVYYAAFNTIQLKK